jgi:hypothetical protein
MNRDTRDQDTDTRFPVTRRTLLEAGTAVAALSFIGHSQSAPAAALPAAEPPPRPVTIEFQVNGSHQALTVDPRTTLRAA